jgi:transposase-like protein
MEHKKELLRAKLGRASTGETACKYQLSPKLLDRWRAEWRAKGGLAFPGSNSDSCRFADLKGLGQFARRDLVLVAALPILGS